jgi:hypothetical protein
MYIISTRVGRVAEEQEDDMIPGRTTPSQPVPRGNRWKGVARNGSFSCAGCASFLWAECHKDGIK